MLESNVETSRTRRNLLLYYLEDDTLEIVEPKQLNSGLYQGTFLKRIRLQKPTGEYYKWNDLTIGFDLKVFGRVFSLYDWRD